MRIIAGRAKGIQLISPPAAVRPPTDRIKEAMFSSLEPWTDKVVVDLFAGSGSMGLEALSRGARAVYMFELERRHVATIRKNLAKVEKSMGEPAGAAQIIPGNAIKVASYLAGIQPDVVLADPPFFPQRGQGGASDLLTDPDLPGWLGDGLLVLRQSTRHDPLPETPHWQFLRDKRYGDSIVYFLKAHQPRS